MGKTGTGALDRDFVTIYLLQGGVERRQVSIRRLSLLLVLLLIGFGLVFFRVWQEMQVMKLGYEIVRLRKESRVLEERQRVLVSRRNSLVNLERVERIAREDLGMQLPQKDQLVFLTDCREQKSGWAQWFFGRWFQRN